MKRLLALALLCLPIHAATTTVTDTIRVYDGALFAGKITITAPLMTTAAGDTIAGWQRTYTVTAGAFSAALEPNDTATPAGTSYLVRYLPNQGSSLLEYWVVTTSVTPLKISAVRVSSVPTPALTIALSQLSTSGAVKGDIMAFGTSWGSQAVGTNGYVLTADSTQTRGFRWAAATGGVTSVFGRTGAVVAASGDFNTSQVTEVTNLYFTNLRATTAMAGLYEVPLTFSLPLVRTVNTLSCPTCITGITKAFGYSFDGGGSALTSGVTGYLTIPFACTITAWNIAVDAGTATFDVWKIGTGTAIPTVTNTITAAALPAISTGTAKHSTVLSGWTTAVSANDVIGINLSIVATATFANLTVQCTQ